MISFEIIKDINKWQDIYDTTAYFHGKAYYSPLYCKAIENNGEGEACLCYCELDTTNGKVQILYPFILKKIPEELTKDLSPEPLYDIESPYGYGGPMILLGDGYVYSENREPSDDIARIFTNEFLKYAEKEHIVAEFVRFNPITMNHNLFISHYSIYLNRRTVCINTAQSFERMLSSASSARRRNYYKAQDCGVQVGWFPLSDKDAMECFRKLYDTTMNRLDADKYYHFSDAYFNTLAQLPEEDAVIGIAAFEERPIGAILLLTDGMSAHYHLGGSDEEYKNLQPTSLLLWEAARVANLCNLECLHLGGGLSLDENDNLFAYKKGFSNQVKEFYIGKRIFNPILYYSISDAWVAKTGKTPKIHLHYHSL